MEKNILVVSWTNLYLFDSIKRITRYPITCQAYDWPSLDFISMNIHHWTHQDQAFAFLLGADSIYTEIRSVENLGLSAIMIFTWFIVTHVSILTSDISTWFYNQASKTYRTFCYLLNLKWVGVKKENFLKFSFLALDLKSPLRWNSWAPIHFRCY